MRYRKLKGYKYMLVDEVFFQTNIEHNIQTEYIIIYNGLLTIKVGYAWDGPSGPTIDTRSFMRGSLIHDALYQLMREGKLSARTYRKYADHLLRIICIKDGMSRFRARYVYSCVRSFAAKSSKKRKNPRGQIVNTLMKDK